MKFKKYILNISMLVIYNKLIRFKSGLISNKEFWYFMIIDEQINRIRKKKVENKYKTIHFTCIRLNMKY